MRKTTRPLSRRAFGRWLAGSGIIGGAASLPAQAPPGEEELAAARRRSQAGRETLAKLDLPSATEPAFLFRP